MRFIRLPHLFVIGFLFLLIAGFLFSPVQAAIYSGKVTAISPKGKTVKIEYAGGKKARHFEFPLLPELLYRVPLFIRLNHRIKVWTFFLWFVGYHTVNET